MKYTRLIKSDTWHWHRDCSHFPAAGVAKVSREKKPTNGELCDQCRAKDRQSAQDSISQGTPIMSKRTDKLAAAAKLAAENAAKDVQAAHDKLEAAKAAEAADALKSPADKAMERAFARGVLPESDRRAPEAIVVDGAVVDVEPERVVVDTSDGSPVTLIATDAPPTGVRSPATREIDNNLLSTVLDHTPGTPVPALVTAPPTQPESVRVVAVEGVEGVARIVPNVPPSVETRGPLVPLVPLNAVHPSTVEAAISDQRIPNDQIHGVFEDADGVKRDALGHVFTPDPTQRVVPPMTGKGF